MLEMTSDCSIYCLDVLDRPRYYQSGEGLEFLVGAGGAILAEPGERQQFVALKPYQGLPRIFISDCPRSFWNSALNVSCRNADSLCFASSWAM